MDGVGLLWSRVTVDGVGLLCADREGLLWME